VWQLLTKQRLRHKVAVTPSTGCDRGNTMAAQCGWPLKFSGTLEEMVPASSGALEILRSLTVRKREAAFAGRNAVNAKAGTL
jgi:hypothetical protein